MSQIETVLANIGRKLQELRTRGEIRSGGLKELGTKQFASWVYFMTHM